MKVLINIQNKTWLGLKGKGSRRFESDKKERVYKIMMNINRIIIPLNLLGMDRKMRIKNILVGYG